MKTKKIDYCFWSWSPKLQPVLSMLARLADYELDEAERMAIVEGLKQTNDEKDQWAAYSLVGRQYTIRLKLAFDAEEGEDMIHWQVETTEALKDKLIALDLFQSMFKEIIE